MIKYPRLAFFQLFLIFASSSFAHEARINPEQRDAIRNRLGVRSCVDTAFEVARGGNSRSAVRGISRGTISEQPSIRLPNEAERYSSYFSLVIQAELELPYGKKTDPESSYFFQNDRTEGKEKAKVLSELGVKWNENDFSSVSVPTWIEMAKSYRNALNRREISVSNSFLPCLVLYRDASTSSADSIQSPKSKREYLFVDPLNETFPADMNLWKVLDKDVQFNIPFSEIYNAMREGKFPLLDAVHDIAHLVSFLRFPEFAKALREQTQVVSADKVTSGFKGREYWLTEALSVLDPAGQQSNLRFLEAQGRNTQVRTVDEIEVELRRMNVQNLVEYSYNLAKYFEEQLRDISGGNSNSAEKWFYLSENFGMSPGDLLSENISNSAPLPAAMDLAKIFFDDAPVRLNANPKAITNETSTFNFNTFSTAQKLIALSLIQNRTEGYSHSQVIDQLTRFTSRTEHLLTLRPFSYSEWCQSFLKPDMSASEPLTIMLKSVFSNEVLEKYYFGMGQSRARTDRK